MSSLDWSTSSYSTAAGSCIRGRIRSDHAPSGAGDFHASGEMGTRVTPCSRAWKWHARHCQRLWGFKMERLRIAACYFTWLTVVNA